MADYKIRIVVEGEDRASGPLARAAGSVQRIGEFAAGSLVARGFETMVRGAGNVAGGLASMVMEGGNFEAQIDSINALLGGTEQEAAQIAGLITDLGIDKNLKVTSEEAAQTVEMLVRNGLDLQDVMDGATRSTVLLSNATGADFAVAADISTDAMSMFGLAAENTGDAVNGIVGVVTNSKLSVEDYGYALAQAGGVASSVGVSFDDFNTIIGLAAPNFASGSDLGTSFKTMLQRLTPQTSDAADMMRDLGLYTGLTTDEFEGVQEKIQKTQAKIERLDPTSKSYAARLEELQSELHGLQSILEYGNSAFFDQNGNMEDMAVVASELSNALVDLSDEERIHALSAMFGTDAMRMAAAMIGYTQEEIEQYQKTLLATDAERSAAMRMNNLAGDVEILGGIFETVRLQVGEQFQPAVRSGIGAVTTMLESLAPSIVAMADSVANAIQPYSDALATWAEGAVEQFAQVNAEIGGGVPGFVGGMGAITGGTVAYDAEATVTTVNWGDYSYTYDADSGVTTVDWGTWTGAYDAEAGVVSVDWEAANGDGGIAFEYEAGAGVTYVDWNGGEGGLHYTYDADADVVTVDFGVFPFTYKSNSEVTWVRFGNFTHTYSADSAISQVQWGNFRFSYSADAGITNVAFGTFSWTYDVAAKVSTVEWGETSEGAASWLDETAAKIGEFFGVKQQVAVAATVDEVDWGDYTNTYDAGAAISESKVSWGEHTNVYDAGAMVAEGHVFWGQWMGNYGAMANVTGVDFGNYTHTYNATVRVNRILDDWAAEYDGPQSPHQPTAPPERAIGDLNWRGGLVQVHRDEILGIPAGGRIYTKAEAREMQSGGMNFTINVANMASDMDLDMLAYQIMDRISMRR